MISMRTKNFKSLKPSMIMNPRARMMKPLRMMRCLIVASKRKKRKRKSKPQFHRRSQLRKFNLKSSIRNSLRSSLRSNSNLKDSGLKDLLELRL